MFVRVSRTICDPLEGFKYHGKYRTIVYSFEDHRLKGTVKIINMKKLTGYKSVWWQIQS
jgi:hypothetical protein